jgi:hypothetical protein
MQRNQGNERANITKHIMSIEETGQIEDAGYEGFTWQAQYQVLTKSFLF